MQKGRYVLWLIVLLSLTYFQFTATARRFVSWLSIVCDERRFMCHPVQCTAYARLAHVHNKIKEKGKCNFIILRPVIITSEIIFFIMLIDNFDSSFKYDSIEVFRTLIFPTYLIVILWLLDSGGCSISFYKFLLRCFTKSFKKIVK